MSDIIDDSQSARVCDAGEEGMDVSIQHVLGAAERQVPLSAPGSFRRGRAAGLSAALTAANAGLQVNGAR